MATVSDSFMGAANTYVDCRKMTNADGLANGHEWSSSLNGAVARIHSSGTGAICYFNPLAGLGPVALIAHTFRLAQIDAVVSGTVSALGGSNYLQIGTNIDVLTGKGYYLEVGNFGFGGQSARITDGTNLVNVSSGNNFVGAGGTAMDLSGIVGPVFQSLLTASVILSGGDAGKHRLVAEYKLGTGAWVTLMDCVVVTGEQQTVPSGGGSVSVWFGNFGNAGNLTGFTGTGTTITQVPVPGITADVVWCGDSNGQYLTPAGAGLGGKTLPRAVADQVKALGYAGVRMHNMSQSGTTSGDWANATGNNQYLKDHAVKLAQYKGSKIVVLAQGTNDAKDSVNTVPATYKTNLQNQIAAFMAVGVTNFIIINPAWVSGSASDFSGANARIQNYATQTATLATSTVTVVTGLYAYFQTNNGATFLPDAIHYALGTAGAPAAKDILVAGVSPVVQAVYALPATIGAAQTVFKNHYNLTPSDTVVFPQPLIIRVGSAGDVTIGDANGNLVFYKNAQPGERLAIAALRLMESGTNAANFVGMNG